jgi:hypothetical protein
MSIVNRFISLLLVLVLSAGVAVAQTAKVKGRGEVVYQGVFRQGSTDERQAIVEAKKSALRRFAADFEPARFQLFQRSEPEILARLDDYVIDYVVVDQQVDKTSKRFAIVIEATVNASRIEHTLQQAGMAQTASAASSNFVFIFVARELAARKSFDPKQTKVSMAEQSESVTESTSGSADGSSATTGSTVGQINSTTEGGSSEVKAEALSYRVTTVTEVDSAVNAVLSRAGFETVDPADAGIDVEKFKKDFSSGQDITPATRTEAIAVLRTNDVRYMAIANMDVGLPEKDEVTGLTRVYVTVTAKVTHLPSSENGARKMPTTVASIAGRPFAGLGPNAQVARTNALNEAAAKSAQELTDQLRAKQIT